MRLSPETITFFDKLEAQLQPQFKLFSQNALVNQAKMLAAFQAERIGTHHFQASTGYGYHDIGREALERVFARVFKAEAALVRQQLVSGTHAIACAIFGNLTPDAELLIASGQPYETLNSVLGISGEEPETISQTAGFKVRITSLTQSGSLDINAIPGAITDSTKLVFIQRSCGYSERPSLSLSDLRPVVQAIKNVSSGLPVMVDNCYGEFVETEEPLAIGADLIAGSLIKNPGGCLAPSGGYIAGNRNLINKAAERLYVPKLGGEIGPSLLNQQIFFQGFFEAPHRVSEMLKGAVLAAKLFSAIGWRVSPLPEEPRADIIQKIFFRSPESLINFCQAIQRFSPIESHVLPEPAELPGYQHKVIMGGGTFISGATSEFSVDAPITKPYIAYLQGGLSYTQIKLSLAGIFESNIYKDQ